MTRLEQLISNTEKWPRRSGKAEYITHLKGGRLTARQAIKAKCYECTAGEEASPCMVIGCALAQHNPRNRKRTTQQPKRTTNDTPEGVG